MSVHELQTICFNCGLNKEKYNTVLKLIKTNEFMCDPANAIVHVLNSTTHRQFDDIVKGRNVTYFTFYQVANNNLSLFKVGNVRLAMVKLSKYFKKQYAMTDNPLPYVFDIIDEHINNHVLSFFTDISGDLSKAIQYANRD